MDKTTGIVRLLSDLYTQMLVVILVMIEHVCHIAQGQWLAQEAKQSSTLRELRAVHKVLESLTTKLQNCRVHWLTDNQNVV